MKFVFISIIFIFVYTEFQTLCQETDPENPTSLEKCKPYPTHPAFIVIHFSFRRNENGFTPLIMIQLKKYRVNDHFNKIIT